MSGYAGADVDAEHAAILNENAIHAAVTQLPTGNFRFTTCISCGEEIPQARRQAILGCMLCVTCAEDIKPNRPPKMLTRML